MLVVPQERTGTAAKDQISLWLKLVKEVATNERLQSAL
jgi:hypothetical protein